MLTLSMLTASNDSSKLGPKKAEGVVATNVYKVRVFNT